jgi:hypothetical protein
MAGRLRRQDITEGALLVAANRGRLRAKRAKMVNGEAHGLGPTTTSQHAITEQTHRQLDAAMAAARWAAMQ